MAGMRLSEVFPVLGLRVRCGPVELVPITDDVIEELADLVQEDVHEPGFMPFTTPWTLAPAAERPFKSAQFWWSQRASFTRDRWAINFAVRHEGVVKGTQGASATNYPLLHAAVTGSWLALRHQGQGVGTLMRQAICALLFDHLDAEQLVSGAFLDNPKSLGVSRKLGYVANGEGRRTRGPGQWGDHQDLLLRPERFVRAPHPVEVEGVEPVRALMGLDAGQ